MQFEFTDDAQEDLYNIESYLLRFWSVRILENFILKLENAIDILVQKNVFFEKYESTGHYKYLLTKHNSIIYNYNNNVLIIYRILQNFQDPEENLNYFQDED